MFNRNRPDRDDRVKFRGYLQGRSSRLEYWAGIGVLVVVVLAAAILRLKLGTALGFPLLFLMIRRLHDAGRTGWWALAVQAAPALGVLAAAPLIGPLPAAGLGLLVTFVAVIGLGWLPEDGPNRFGDPRRRRQRPAAAAQDLGEVFS